MPVRLRRRFERFKSMVRARIHILDGTEGGVSVARMEQVLMSERDKGFVAHALLVDYDEEITPSKRHDKKQTELDEIYRDLRQFIARWNLVGWTAAQTQRNTRHLKILIGDRVADDIGKMKKVTVALSLGKGEWADDAYYVWVAAHKNDQMNVGCEIIPDLKRSIFYDREATRSAAKEHAADPDA